MANGKNVDESTLKEWIQNFRGNANLPFSTNSATVSLDQLENFIKEAREKYGASMTGFRLYPIRYKLKAGGWKETNIKEEGRGISQPSFVLVPLKNYNPADASGTDYILENPGDLYVLAFSDPDDPGDSTGLCPPKC